jgi:ATP adenylyltransferase
MERPLIGQTTEWKVGAAEEGRFGLYDRALSGLTDQTSSAGRTKNSWSPSWWIFNLLFSGMTDHEVVSDCQICLKHVGEGPLTGALIGRTKQFWVWHAPVESDGRTRLGHLIIESDRHSPYLADLTYEEAAELGRLRTRIAHSLRSALDAEFVMAAVIGMGVAHFHEHIYARPTREPDDVGWYDSDQLLALGDDDAVKELSDQLKPALEEVQSND